VKLLLNANAIVPGGGITFDIPYKKLNTLYREL